MSEISNFFKKNKTVKPNAFFAATKSLCDGTGKPLIWEIRALSTKENTRIQDECTVEIPVKGKPNLFTARLNANKYLDKMLAASVVFPDLLNAELQDSYGVNQAEDLLKELLDNPAEFNAFVQFVQEFNGFNVTLQEQVDEAKN